MKIGFYGDSRCTIRHQFSFIDLIAKYFTAEIVNIGAKQGSEERILFELKKTKNLDLAIVFHSNPNHIFLPGCERDVHIKINLEKAEYILPVFEHAHSKKNHPNFRKKFKSAENFVHSLQILDEYFHHNDLLRNRFYGSLIQIDQYLFYKKIPTLHIIEKENNIPKWFKFESGKVIQDINNIFTEHATVSRDTEYINGITIEGNQLVFEKLKEIVEAEMSPSPAGVV